MSRRPQCRFIHFAANSACALLTTFCSSASERSRGATACEFAPAQTLGPIANSAKEEGSPTVSADETELFFTSGRNGQEDLFVSTRPGRESPWGEPANLGESVNDSIGDDFSLRLTMNGLALYFASNRVGGFGAGDLYVTTRDSLDREWGRATNPGAGPQHCGLRRLSNAEPGYALKPRSNTVICGETLMHTVVAESR